MNHDNQFIFINQSLHLAGTVSVEGAKNAALAIIPAALLSSGISILRNIPDSNDIHKTTELLSWYGVTSFFCKKTKSLTLDTTNIRNTKAPVELYQSTRASTIIAGAILGKLKEAFIALPGGDNIGKRPINIHLDSFKSMGASIYYDGKYIKLVDSGVKGTAIFLDYPSVGATQNILLLASQISEKTILKNAAQEPEIEDLISVLRLMGVHIECSFPNTIIIIGSKKLKPFDHTLIPDRLEAGTLLLASAITGGTIHIPNAPVFAMEGFLKKLSDIGHELCYSHPSWGITLIASDNPKPIQIKTMPYPGFPTDLQSPMMSLLAITNGESSMHETVFENRMKHAEELNKLGASISVEYDFAKIKGVSELYGNSIEASDIRSCSSLILAGLVAKGKTKIKGVPHLLRGYEKLDKKLQLLGADISISEEHSILSRIDLSDETRANYSL